MKRPEPNFKIYNCNSFYYRYFFNVRHMADPFPFSVQY